MMMRWVLGLGLAVALLGAPGCNRTTETPPPPAQPGVGQGREELPMPESYDARIEQFIERGRAFRLGDSRQEIVENLGEPQRTEVEHMPNRHDPTQMDYMETLHYDGMRVYLYHVTADNRDILQRVIISNPRWAVQWGLDVGAPIARVYEVLGPPDRTTEGDLVYEDEDPVNETVTFSEDNGVIGRIDWRYYVD